MIGEESAATRVYVTAFDLDGTIDGRVVNPAMKRSFSATICTR